MITIAVIVAIIIFLVFQNAQYNRTVDRRNRILEKQQELIDSLQAKETVEKNDENGNDEN